MERDRSAGGPDVVLDDHVVELDDLLLYGGAPPRVLRLAEEDRSEWRRLGVGSAALDSPSGLTRRLLDIGVVHPRPAPAHDLSDLEVVVPVRGRADHLDRCLSSLGLGAKVVVVDDGSPDPDEVARVVRRHGARLHRRPTTGGPAAARNAGVRATTAPLVAFVDSDVRVDRDTLAALAGHVADPTFGASAPRVLQQPGSGWFGRYVAARGPLDLGARAARVGPRSPVTYVPTAVLVCRRSALLDVARAGDAFDERLRYGEDVDLVWRLADRGWTVRYDPGRSAGHAGATRWRDLVARRFSYGTSAGPLARRHPEHVACFRGRAWPLAVVLALVGRRFGLASGAMVGYWASMWIFLRRRSVPRRGLGLAGVRGVVDVGHGVGRAGSQLALPAIVASVALRPRAASGIGTLVLAASLREWWPHRHTLGPLRFVAAMLVEDCAYGAGIWTSTARSRTVRPLLPRVSGRSVQVESWVTAADLSTQPTGGRRQWRTR